MKEYDNAAYRYYKRLNLVSLPLISWDIYGQHFDALCRNYDDIKSLQRLSENNKWAYDSKFNDSLIQKEQVIVVTDANQTIIYATNNISTMNGYMPDEVVGKSPKIFQGSETDKEVTIAIGKAVRDRVSFENVITNYRKDGTTYNCWIKGEPIFDLSGQLVNFIAYEKKVA